MAEFGCQTVVSNNILSAGCYPQLKLSWSVYVTKSLGVWSPVSLSKYFIKGDWYVRTVNTQFNVCDIALYC